MFVASYEIFCEFVREERHAGPNRRNKHIAQIAFLIQNSLTFLHPPLPPITTPSKVQS